jgi:cell division septation protein DedD
VEGAEEQETVQAVWYLEVGSFKDANWAQQAVEKLSALGYHAISVHQTRLWMQSFHVQVGPFKDPKELGDAQQSLAARGFKPHRVK